MIRKNAVVPVVAGTIAFMGVQRTAPARHVKIRVLNAKNGDYTFDESPYF